MSDFYSENADAYIAETFNCDMSVQYAMFIKYLPPFAKILDLGCGSGRDSLFFISKGYHVFALDPTREFCEHAKKIGIANVYKAKVQDMNFCNIFDGIWACASLVHVNHVELNQAFFNCSKALKLGGYLYVSFKYGDFMGFRDEREYIDLTEESIKNYLDKTNFMIISINVTKDNRSEKSGKWLNAVLKKMKE